MNDTAATAPLAEQARRALAAHDRNARVELGADGGLLVYSDLDQATVLRVLQTAALPAATAVPARSDCCGGCCGA